MKFASFLLVIAFLVSCKKKEEMPCSALQDNFENGILVLNEGLIQQNNTTLSFIDLASTTVSEQVFATKNARPLGDTGNDMRRYGGKIYVVMNNSGTVEVINAKTGISIKQIAFNNGTTNYSPRQISFLNDKAYVSSYDGYVNVIDTNSLTIINRIQVGTNPEGIATDGTSIYVANSGGLNFPIADSTVMKIDVGTNQVVDTFVVGQNPGDLVCDAQGDIYVVKRGDYDTNPSELIRIEPSLDNVTNLGISALTLEKDQDDLIIGFYNYSNSLSNVSIFNTLTENLTTSNAVDGSGIIGLYGAYRLPNGKLAVLDANGFTTTGYLRIFNQGTLENTYNVGLNPNSIIYYE